MQVIGIVIQEINLRSSAIDIQTEKSKHKFQTGQANGNYLNLIQTHEKQCWWI